MVFVAGGAAVAGGIASAAISSSGAKSAAGTEASAAQQAAAQQAGAAGAAGQLDVQGAANANVLDVEGLGQAEQNTNNFLGEAQGELQPFVSTGQSADNQLLGLGGFTPTGLATGATAGLTQAQLEQTPGYQFTLQQGLESTQNSAASQGLGVSGAAQKAAANYATGDANSTYATDFGVANQAYANELGAYQTNANRLLGTAQIGSGAAGTLGNLENLAGQTSTNAILGTTEQMASNTAGAFQSAGNALVGAAGATAQGINSAGQDIGSGQLASANDVGSSLQSIGNSASQLALLNQFSSQAGGESSNPFTTGFVTLPGQ